MASLMTIGCAIILGGKAYCLFFHPEWTEMMQLIHLWWCWLIGAALIVLPAAWLRAKEL